MGTRGNLHSLVLLPTLLAGAAGSQVLHQAKLILALFAAEFNFVHALPHEMEAPAPAANFLEGTALHFPRGRPTYAGVPAKQFDPLTHAPFWGAMQVAAGHFNGAADFPR